MFKSLNCYQFLIIHLLLMQINLSMGQLFDGNLAYVRDITDLQKIEGEIITQIGAIEQKLNQDLVKIRTFYNDVHAWANSAMQKIRNSQPGVCANLLQTGSTPFNIPIIMPTSETSDYNLSLSSKARADHSNDVLSAEAVDGNMSSTIR
ncbi:uncharacterized protein LOC119644700 [Glossina fuscipes]|uniref:Uncharacterized protein LOC119644700 n=1 Tax=Glossina fuscipes TaxID=7396 RepID=A0A9C5ZNC6_9MUSC|nr:uncharacterized protein LOC119644700 [Glossina fuscipes]KAI9589716.1 hypothetical protein GQX74_007884 [Glossina fuscipes]